jgi:hypothetical protein
MGSVNARGDGQELGRFVRRPTQKLGPLGLGLVLGLGLGYTTSISIAHLEQTSNDNQWETNICVSSAQLTVAATGNTEAELASSSPEMIAEDAATVEMLLEQPPLLPRVIETLLVIFHPILL